ncbi:transposase [Colletotrichum incanum]|uniref:Transposase n=1 Tax=Colletotrichum incanum TaxID=1573173 RepID=A0A166RV54_COLIC|nr:transposase [Colletotrichum incanum]
MYDIIDFQAKGISKLAHKLALVEAEKEKYRTAVEILSKRRRAKKTQLRLGSSLNTAEAEALQVEKDSVDAGGENNRQKEGRTEGAEPRARRCGNCGKTGHNARTCEVVWDSDEEEGDE